MILAPKQKAVYTWADQTMGVKKILVQVDGKDHAYSIDKIKKLKEFKTDKDTVTHFLTTFQYYV